MRTVKTLAMLLAVGMLLGLAGAARANLILNPGFEADSDGDLNPDFWTRSGLDRVKDFDLNIAPYEGNFQFQLQSTGTLTQQVVLPAAGQYNLGMWIASRPDNTHHLGPIGNNEVKLQLRDASNVVVAADSAVTGDYDAPRGTYVEWTRTYNSLAAGTYTVEVRSDGPGSGANQGMVDAFSLVGPPGPPPPPPPPTTAWTFDEPAGPDEQGWVDVLTSAVGNANTDFDAFSSAWGRSPQGGVGWLAPGTNGASGWNQRDGQNDPFVIRSPSFVLGAGGEISFYLQGGVAGGAAPGNFSGLGGTQFLGLALRDDATGNYVLSAGRPGNGDGYQKVVFSAAQLAPLVGGTFTLDYIDDKKGGWGWGGIDTVTVPIQAPSVIPEPITMLAVGLGITSLGGYVRKRRRA